MRGSSRRQRCVRAVHGGAGFSPRTASGPYLAGLRRALEAGCRIAVALTPAPFPPGVDTPDDLARAEALMASQPG